MVTTYFITGTSRGLGLGFVQAYLKQDNVKVFAAARNPSACEALQSLAKQYGDKLSLIDLELTSEDSIKAACATVSAASPTGIDVLINNGGYLGNREGADPFESSAEDYMKVLQINVVSMYLICKHFLPLVRKGALKKIINTSSTAAQLKPKLDTVTKGGEYFPGLLPYKSSKAAVNMQTVVMANALAKDGITLIALHPGFVATDMGNTAGAPVNLTPAMTVEESVAAQVATIARVGPKDSGAFLSYDGSVLEY